MVMVDYIGGVSTRKVDVLVPQCQQRSPLGLTRPPRGPTVDHATALWRRSSGSRPLLLNAAQAFQTAELLGVPPLAIPYQAAWFEALGRELIAITRAEPTTADSDREIVDGWAEKLGLSRWYVWKTP